MTREEIERELFKDQCAKNYPSVPREEATAYVEECKPIAERNYKLEATQLYDEVILRYGRLIWGPLLETDREVELLKRLVRAYADPFDVTPEDHAIVVALGIDDEEGYQKALEARGG